jgi:competence protein ComEA
MPPSLEPKSEIPAKDVDAIPAGARLWCIEAPIRTAQTTISGTGALVADVTVNLTSFEAILLLLLLTIASIAQSQLPEGPGKKTVENSCGTCHDVDTATDQRRTKTEWQETVDAMVNRGARATDEEIKLIIEYLVKYFGMVNVNKATAKELENVLGISAREAQAIVQYHVNNGDFKELDDLKKVSGVDAKLIEERKDLVTFK